MQRRSSQLRTQLTQLWKRKPKKIQACQDLKLDLSNTSEGFELVLANCKVVIKLVCNIPAKDEDEIFVKYS